jgi:hypothetical protein
LRQNGCGYYFCGIYKSIFRKIIKNLFKNR